MLSKAVIHRLQYDQLSHADRTRAVLAATVRCLRCIHAIMIENRKAKVAEELCRRLGAMSDADLAKAGIERRRIGEHIRQRLYEVPRDTHGR